MLAELRVKSQITIPKEIVEKLGLSQGDKFEVVERNGEICLIPVVVYSKKYIEQLQSEISELKKNVENGTQPVFDSVDALFEKLEG